MYHLIAGGVRQGLPVMAETGNYNAIIKEKQSECKKNTPGGR